MAFPITPENLVERLSKDEEFKLAARYWTGGFVFESGTETFAISIVSGVAKLDPPMNGDVIVIRGPADIWLALTQPVPPRIFNDLGPALALMLELKSDPLTYTQHYPALMRAVEVMRGVNPDQVQTVECSASDGAHDSPIGRYVNMDVSGERYRIYYEEAGEGIPLILQHTAGANGTQWRHLFEDKEITSKFRLLAYDLPFHGKSVPPTNSEWWKKEYKLKGQFLRDFVLKFSEVLQLERPAFMGCSVGGALALDLACRHPNAFRAVVSVEGVLNIEGDLSDYNHNSFHHPKVSNEFKGRLMHGLTSPTAPEAYRRETIQTYMAGWPAAFLGDLFYYVEDFDVRALAGSIDTSVIGVHIMNGEYDFSGAWELGEEAHKTIKGSTWTKMEKVGHFPMCEDPDRFIKYLKPILNEI